MKYFESIRHCKGCNLCFNQPPLLDKRNKAQVFWVGLSAVRVSDIKNDIPLSNNTNSGKLISNVERNNKHLSFYKTNLVKCLPLENNKIRYPKKCEMESCYRNLKIEINKEKPKIVILLGKLVSDFILKIENKIQSNLDDNFKYEYYKINNIYYIPIHHPSFILVYKRKFLNKYIKGISNIMNNIGIEDLELNMG